MADRIVIEGIPPYDGDWEFDASYFTMREFHTIKKVTGLRGGELSDAIESGDMDVVVGLAVVALQRNNIDVNPERIWDAKGGSISFIADEGDVDPPDLKAA